MSMWSANRDIACGTNYMYMQIVSDACNGVQQDVYSFASCLSADFDGSIFLSANLVRLPQAMPDPCVAVAMALATEI